MEIDWPKCNLAAFYDNTIEFRRFAIYKKGKQMQVSNKILLWYKRFMEEVKRVW